MDIFNNILFKEGALTGLGTNVALGLGFIILGPAIASIGGRILRPVAKAVIKGGILVYDQVRSFATDTQKSTEHFASESRAELAGERPVSFSGETPATADVAARHEETYASEKEEIHPERESEYTKPWIVRGY